MKKHVAIVTLYFAVGSTALFGQTANPIIRLSTVVGNIDVELSPSAAPKNVANFQSYLNSGAYNGSFIHRSAPGFVIQGGGYTFPNGSIQAIPTRAAVANEYKLPNVRGTLAMALVGSDPNSATDQWFFNLADNSATLDAEDGGFTVIGAIVNSDGLAVMDAIAALPVLNEGSPFDQLPVVSSSGASLTASNLVLVNSATVLASHPSFFDGEVSVGNGVEYLSFPGGNYFGYYSYLTDSNYIYHFDLGYEYIFDANDSKSGIYLYDFKSGHFFYSSPSYPYPYLYDFTLGTVLYYYPDPSNPGHYDSNGVRYFYNFATGQIISQ